MNPVLYYKHEATGDLVAFRNKSVGHLNFLIPNTYLYDEWRYLCVVFEGQVFAGRGITTPNISFNVLRCVPFGDNNTGKEILMKHFLLYGE